MIDKNDMCIFLKCNDNLFLRLILCWETRAGLFHHIHIYGFENDERSQLNEAGETRPFCRLNVGHNVGHKLGHRAFFMVESLAFRWHDPEQGLTGR